MKHLRKKIWIDPFQTGLLIRIGFYVLLYQVVVWALTIVFAQLNLAATFAGTSWHFLSAPAMRTAAALLILTPPVVMDANRFAHRLVGPLYRFRKTMQALAAGEPVAPVSLRKGDLLVDLRDDFNAMLKTLEEKGLVLIKDPEQAVTAETAETAS